MAGSAAQIEYPLSVDVAEQFAIETIDVSGPELDRRDWSLLSVITRGRVPRPVLHECDCTFPVRWAT